ncbi:hypothetical protein LOD99_15028 [Oopsacas minuta]|uniref:Uncharacterized protein n=1 Tax=Oopsacas minuta TaxID=111878 RepID=A0AAV7KDI3_9METZ|nr:hypothetical protein LOD99_15028 [Oopsacas minuta]
MASFLDYTTYKYVTVRDKRLGITYYIFAFLIFAYLLQDIFIDKGYLKIDTNPHGTLRLLVKDPNNEAPITDLPYCPEFAGDAPGKFQYNRTDPCVDYDAQELSWPPEAHAVNIMTYGKDNWQERKKNEKGSYNFETISEKQYFTRNPETTILKIDHSIISSLFSGKYLLGGSHRTMLGFLVGKDDNIIRKVSESEKPDKLKVSELLKAAGIDTLDQLSDSLSGDSESFRMRGLILKISIYYTNHEHKWFGTGQIHYTYKIQHIPLVDYQTKQIIPIMKEKSNEELETEIFHTNKRLLRKRYSLRLIFEQEGSLGKTSLNALIYQLIAGTSLLTLLATVIDVVALNLIPTYSRYMMDSSPELGKKEGEIAGGKDKDDAVSVDEGVSGTGEGKKDQ